MDFLDRAVPLTANLVIPVKSMLVIGTALVTLGGLHFFVNRTRLGMAIRAVAQDPDTASLMGVPVNRVIALTFFVGGSLGGLAGVLFGIHYSLVNPYSGFIPGMKAFTAAVLGGIGNIPGAMVGGMMLGLLEAFAASYLSLMTDGAFGAECWSYFFLSSAGRTVIISKLRFRSASSLHWRSGLTSSLVSSGYLISVSWLFTPSALISGRSSARLKLTRLFQATCFRCRLTGFSSFSS